MAENIVDVNEKDVQKCDESSITMLDVLEQEKEMEDEYAAVLGASDEKYCTYNQGLVKRQALYSCLTCCPEARKDKNKCAGICLACSYKCHENHELVELYTKRNFRCDCPTKRFNGNACVLNPTLKEKPAVNEYNLYNQNFQGLYCVCHRPYPDPERTIEELMLQCAICEDWLHLEHLDLDKPPTSAANGCNEMVCSNCMKSYSFLRDYTGFALKVVEDGGNQSVVNVTDEPESNEAKLRSNMSDLINTPQLINSEELKPNNKNAKLEDIPKNETEENISDEPDQKRIKVNNDVDNQPNTSKNIKSNREKCLRPTHTTDWKKGAVFWEIDWRKSLCRCKICLDIYKAEKIEFLLDVEDSAKIYEERGMKRAAAESSSYEQGIQALASIDRVKQIDAITEYNIMKDKLKEYLHTFVINNKIVTEEDINRFFRDMRDQRSANQENPFHCR